MARFFHVLADASTATDNTAALYTLVGVIVAALLSTLGAIVAATVGKRKDAPLDAGPDDVNVLVGAYQDARRDLDKATSKILLLEAELDESKAMTEHLMHELTQDRTPRRPRKATS